MTTENPATQHQRPEAPALADARLQLQRSASAIRAAACVAPHLRQLGDLHAQCIDVIEQLRELERAS